MVSQRRGLKECPRTQETKWTLVPTSANIAIEMCSNSSSLFGTNSDSWSVWIGLQASKTPAHEGRRVPMLWRQKPRWSHKNVSLLQPGLWDKIPSAISLEGHVFGANKLDRDNCSNLTQSNIKAWWIGDTILLLVVIVMIISHGNQIQSDCHF